MTSFNKIEQEAIALNAIWGMIDGLVNYGLFVESEQTIDTNFIFKSSVHARLFNILLGDFLAQPQRRGQGPLPFDLPQPPSGAPQSDLTYLYYLRQVSDGPLLGSSAAVLREPLEAFADWLDAHAVVPKVWLPSIETELTIRVPRIAFLKICGDIAKHNFARLEANVRKIERILADNGHPVEPGRGYAVLPEFYEWLHTNVFIYHSSTIAEFLNNIRWAIYDYLSPEFTRAFKREDELRYRFDVPPDITQPIAVEMYWDLMNRCRSRPYFPRFTVTTSLKQRY